MWRQTAAVQLSQIWTWRKSAVIVLLLAVAIRDSDCKGGVHLGTVDGKHIVLSNEDDLNFTAAADYCRQWEGGELLTVENKKENDLLREFLKNDKERRIAGAWIGARRGYEEGIRNFYWIRNHLPLQEGFTDWSQGQPKHHQRKKNCLFFYNPEGTDKRNVHHSWKTWECSAEHNAVCEIPASSSSDPYTHNSQPHHVIRHKEFTFTDTDSFVTPDFPEFSEEDHQYLNNQYSEGQDVESRMIAHRERVQRARERFRGGRRGREYEETAGDPERGEKILI